MTSSASEPTTWNTRRWITVIALIIFLQFLFIYYLSARGHNSSRSISRPFLLEFSRTQWPEDQFAKEFLASDPASFAVPGTHGFSGAAWLRDPVRSYEARSLFEQKESPFWLTLNSGQLGTGLTQFVRTNTAGPVLRTEDSGPKIQTRLLEPANVTKTNSHLRVEGDLAPRRLPSALELASWPHTNILGPTVVRVAVDQNGMVISLRLLKKSGSEQADRFAIDAARQYQFARDGRAIDWGDLVFDWHTVPFEATNNTSTPKLPQP